jgi:hypothetical protein
MPAQRTVLTPHKLRIADDSRIDFSFVTSAADTQTALASGYLSIVIHLRGDLAKAFQGASAQTDVASILAAVHEQKCFL